MPAARPQRRHQYKVWAPLSLASRKQTRSFVALTHCWSSAISGKLSNVTPAKCAIWTHIALLQKLHCCPPPKKGEMCIYIKKLGRGGRRKKSWANGWWASLSLGGSWEMCLLLRGKVLHKLKIRDMWSAVVHPAYLLVSRWRRAAKPKTYSPLLSLSAVSRGGYRSHEIPKKSRES